jgi:hypothetical protein
MRKGRRLIAAVMAGGAIFCTFATPTIAQGPIRVESSQVLVPAVVFDKKLYTLTGKKHHKHSLRYLIARDPHFWDSIAIRDLVAKDFHLFEDGQEQRILSVAFEAPSFSIVQDNRGKHPETIGTGGGRWTYPELARTDNSMWLPWPQYVITYVLSVSLAGSCHQIKVNVGQPNLVVWARGEYCNTPHPASDPLNGTDFGKQMEDDLISATKSKVDLKLRATAFYADTAADRVNIHIEFPSKSLKHEFRDGTLYASIGAVGEVYDQAGSVVARFSDFACCDYGNDSHPSTNSQASGTPSDRGTSMIPNGYETQIDLPAGEYNIDVVLSDGEKFGRARTLLTVQNHDEKQPAISDIALCRRFRKLPDESTESPAQLPGSYVPLVSKGVEFTPTTNSRFASNEMLYAYFEVYDPQLAVQAAPKVTAHLRIVDVKTNDVEIDFQPVDAASYIKPGSSQIRIARGIDLSSLPEGSYELDVQATDSTGKSTVWQKANFSVESHLLGSCSIDLQC